MIFPNVRVNLYPKVVLDVCDGDEDGGGYDPEDEAVGDRRIRKSGREHGN